MTESDRGPAGSERPCGNPEVHAKDVLLDDTVDFEAVALATSGAVGSDLANMINEAAILAVKNGRRAVSQKDLLESVEVVLVGKEKNGPHPERAGAPDRLLPRGGTCAGKRTAERCRAGAEDYDRAENHGRAGICDAGAGGREIPQYPEGAGGDAGGGAWRPCGGGACFETVTTGAANDIEQATKIARAMITQYGMSKNSA